MKNQCKKKDKLIGLSDSDKKALAKMGIDVGISLKAYCERVLERHVAEHAKPENIRNPKMLTPEECFKPVEEVFDTGKKEIPEKKKKTVKVGKTTIVPLEEFNDKPPKSDIIPAKDKKGKFERIENNIYTNGKVFEYRSYTQEKGKVSVFCKTLKEAQELKGE
jgi:hypothetical protein